MDDRLCQFARQRVFLAAKMKLTEFDGFDHEFSRLPYDEELEDED